MIPLLIFAQAVDLQSYDAVIAAPASHHILLEDDRVRVLRVEVTPGQTEPVHVHCWPSVMYFEQPQPITYIEYELSNGVPTILRSVDAPAMEPTETLSVGPEGLHAISNRGSKPFIAVRVEFKEGACLQQQDSE